MLTIRINKADINNSFIYMCAVLVFFETRWISLFTLLLQRIGMGQIGEPLFYTVLSIFFLAPLVNIRKRELQGVIVVYVFAVLAYLYAKLTSPDSFILDTSGFSTIKYFLYYPLILIVFNLIDDYDRLINGIIKAARLFAIVLTLITFTVYTRNDSSFDGYLSYNMTHGYECAKVAIVLLLSLSMKRGKYRLYDTIAFVSMAFSSLVFGSRGSFLTLVVYALIIYVKNYLIEQPDYKRIGYFVVTCFAVLLLGIYRTTILEGLSQALSNYGIESRTLDKLVNDTISTDTGRSVLHLRVLAGWKNMPILGYGILGDRQFISGSYVHNIVLELITDFGYVLAGLIMLALVVLIIKSIRNPKTREFSILIVIITLVNLMFSSSFVINTNFYVMLAVLLISVHNPYINECQTSNY